MSAGLEGITLSRWVYQTLTLDAELAGYLGGAQAVFQRVWEGVAPAGTGEPWIVFTVMEPQDVKGVGMVQVMSRASVMVKVIGKGSSYGPLLPIYKRAHALLEAQSNKAVTDGLVLTSHRVSGVQYPEQVNGTEYRHLGGIYDMYAQ